MYAISIGTHHMRTTHTHPVAPEMPTPYSAVPPHYVKCFTEYLRAAGYYCTNNFKTDYQFDPPLTAWDDLGKDAHWRNRPDPEQPFFAVFNLMRSHESGMWPEKCPSPEFDPGGIEPPPHLPDTPVVREALARMYTHIAHNDREFGSILGQLEADGLADQTCVFNWSDHGPLPRGKRWPYDAGIHVPLIARGPGLEAGRVSEDLVSTVDLGPTMLSLAGVEIPSHLQGQAFLGEQARPTREYVFASRDPPRRVLRHGPGRSGRAITSTSATTGRTFLTFPGSPIETAIRSCRKSGGCTWRTVWTRRSRPCSGILGPSRSSTTRRSIPMKYTVWPPIPGSTVKWRGCAMRWMHGSRKWATSVGFPRARWSQTGIRRDASP